MIRKCLGIVVFLFLGGCCVGQTNLRFETVLDDGRLVLDQPKTTAQGEIAVSVFKFYVSHFRFLNRGQTVLDLPETFFLVDASDEKSKDRNLDLPEGLSFDEIAFTFGIDAQTNDKGVGSGDLDPAKAMYWTWHSGYINCKIEGRFGQQPFEFHLGGFQQPFESAREIRLSRTSAKNVVINIDVNAFLSQLDRIETHVMSPGAKAMHLSDLAIKMFR